MDEQAAPMMVAPLRDAHQHTGELSLNEADPGGKVTAILQLGPSPTATIANRLRSASSIVLMPLLPAPAVI
jgi:hypothetical protein